MDADVYAKKNCKHERTEFVNAYSNPLVLRCLDCGEELRVERQFPV